jgi:2-polyprenyl-3-methyl-5-hydroxy-6-metoxy-1,4-benzoquinol methylase
MYLSHGRPGRVLDVGCGDGARLAWLRQRGWRVCGHDIDGEAARAAWEHHAVTVRVGPLADAGFAAGSFDAITLAHVLEHAPDPVDLLRTCRTLVKPDGVIACITPNIDSWGHRRFRRDWLGLDPPRHLHLFSPVSLRTVAALAGLRQASVWTTAANAQFIAAGSLDLKQRGRHHVGGRGRLDRDVGAALLQLGASLQHLRDRDSGDECVLHATA